MGQAYDEYMVKIGAYQAANETMTRLFLQFREFASPLMENWTTCYIEVFGQPTPMEMIPNRRKVDASKMPPVNDIRSAIISQFQAQQEAAKAWNALSQIERDSLKTPAWLQR